MVLGSLLWCMVCQCIGDDGEDCVLVYLQVQGLQLVQCNFCCKGGEIDLILCEGSIIVFVEVCFCVSSVYGGVVVSVMLVKQWCLLVVVQVWL